MVLLGLKTSLLMKSSKLNLKKPKQKLGRVKEECGRMVFVNKFFKKEI